MQFQISNKTSFLALYGSFVLVYSILKLRAQISQGAK